MVTSFLPIILSILFIAKTYGQCKWTASGETLDLSCMAGKSFTTTDDPSQTSVVHSYTYTVCSDDAGACDTGSLMMRQWLPSDSNICAAVGRWNPGLSPQYTQNDDNEWMFEFQYNNGDDDCGNSQTRNFVPEFICDNDKDFEVGQVFEPGFGGCSYYLPIRTKYACGVPCDDDGSSGLSGGWIFIIILLVGFFVYFVGGYVYMALTVNKDGGFGDFQNNIPNRSLWCSLPSLVIAGCMVTKDTILGLMGKGGEGGEMSEPITDE